jgi:hypothetical protein
VEECAALNSYLCYPFLPYPSARSGIFALYGTRTHSYVHTVVSNSNKFDNPPSISHSGALLPLSWYPVHRPPRPIRFHLVSRPSREFEVHENGGRFAVHTCATASATTILCGISTITKRNLRSRTVVTSSTRYRYFNRFYWCFLASDIHIYCTGTVF